VREDLGVTWVPEAIVVALAATVLAVVIGRIRHDPVRTIGLNAVGYPLFLMGLGVAAEVSMQAFWAAAAASLGSLLFPMAAQRRRTAGPGPAAALPQV
jgi:hypothetical protein